MAELQRSITLRSELNLLEAQELHAWVWQTVRKVA